MVSQSTQLLHLRPFLPLSAAGISAAQVKLYEQLKPGTNLDLALLHHRAHMLSCLQSVRLPRHAVAWFLLHLYKALAKAVQAVSIHILLGAVSVHCL